ncbi:MAG TPA: VacJ family lipoprotein [Smithella sp.]|nr:VacJ family lipoprotein [Smithella sp.]MDM7988079.1 VacJ family lipoprotein [Smithella sp.]HNY49248.1 VacJ family lipoprotein [Smithella sp.]HOG88935.1 VacJ family lipoprotein [Smithella sp.]HOU49693.1 VacJ family lipoprotein [Smithella sp.]
MKSYFSIVFLIVVLLTAGFAHGQESASTTTPRDVSVSQQVAPSPETGVDPTAIDQSQASPHDTVETINEEYKEDEILEEYVAGNLKEEKVEIADPLEPVNRVVHGFNDKLYFWALKPVAQGYKTVLPEPARLSVKNFFSNLAFPARFLSCLLQADFSGAAMETGRFAINTLWGIGGLLDPSSGKELNLQKQDTDLGQTLGVWGVGQGFYIVWPFFGPSSARDTATLVGDYFLYPVSYINPWYDWLAVRTYEEVNATSLRIGDYEALKDAAIDPYVAFRDAYAQYRYKKIKARKAKGSSSAPVTRQEQPAAPVPEREN